MKITVYSKEDCRFCSLTKDLLGAKNIEYEEIHAPTHLNEMMDAIKAAGSQVPRTLPQIFVDGRHIGGYNELARLFRGQP